MVQGVSRFKSEEFVCDFKPRLVLKCHPLKVQSIIFKCNITIETQIIIMHIIFVFETLGSVSEIVT